LRPGANNHPGFTMSQQDPIILSIDTSLETATILLSVNGGVVIERSNPRQMDHASWIHTAIRDMMQQSGVDMRSLSAVAVVEGPGSYTGLRVGMATAKGLCYAAGIPLITISSLLLIAKAQEDLLARYPGALICAMIDARRMEVFSVIYDATMTVVNESRAVILDEHSYDEYLGKGIVIFAGNGTGKWKPVCKNANAVFGDAEISAALIATVAKDKFCGSDFADLAYAEPAYVKNVYIASPVRKEK
jgi:tRNA threonylcarbamoyladenosine biosynthesis protein TsaB